MKKWHLSAVRGIALAVGFMGLFWAATPASANSINTYINNQGYATPKITTQIWSGFPKNSYRYGKPEGVVVHETANPKSTIYNEIAYMKNNYKNAFVHTFIDAGNIINVANTKYLCWGSGYYGNQRYVQFEQVEVHSKSAFANELNKSAYYTAYILNKYGLKPKRNTTVLSHHDVSNNLGGTDHTDPDGYWKANAKAYFGTTYTMADFMSLVNTQYAKITGNSNNSGSTTDDSNQHTSAKPKTVKYYAGTNNETATLANNYTNWTVYNHVKGTAKARKIGWGNLSADHRGAKVYVDSRGVKKGGWSGTWYRIRFAKHSTYKYWVCSNVLNFPKVTYKDANGTKTLNTTTNSGLYNHVLNSDYLSTVTAHTQDFQAGQTIKLNKKGVKSSDNSTWYRGTIGSKSYWVKSTSLK